ncbi:MAG: hypothetical protein ABIW84_07885 [Ilumatobacteraceae bacterium]
MTRVRRVALVVIGFGSVVVGAWAQVWPRSFYDEFPGFGRGWVAVDGPYNEHLVRDVGGLNLGLALAAFWALLAGSVLLARVVGAAALVYGLPHLLYHASHLDDFDTSDAVGIVVGLAFAAAAALVALIAPAGVEHATHDAVGGSAR